VSEFDAPPPAQDGSTLTARAASGLRWSSLGYAGLMVANIAYTVTISRLLDPAAFGLMALAQIVWLFVHVFARMGLASALVQKPELSRDDVRAASSAGIAVGVACLAVVWVLAPLFSGVFRAPALTPVLRALGVSFLFEGMAMVGIGLLRRQLRFRVLSIITFATYGLGYLVVAIGLALLGAGVWSLVIGALVSSASQAVWQYALLRHPVRPVLRWKPYQEVCGYGMRLSGAHLLDYVGSSLDTFTVGRFASTAVVGQYSRGYYLAFQPFHSYLAQALTAALFPHLSRIQQDRARLRRAYLSVLMLSCVLVFPVCAGMAVAAPELVRVVLGPQWGLAATVVPWFALAAGCTVISALSQTAAEARADLNRSMAVQGVYVLALGAFLALAIGYRSNGIWVVAAAVLAAEILRHVGYIGLMWRIVGFSAAQLWESYAPAAYASLGVVLAIAATRRALVGQVPTILVFAADLAAGALALALCIRFCPLPGIRRELRMRLDAAGVLGGAGGLRRRLAPLVVGRSEPAPERQP
jgi:O-antigen/teichoic acid export membrane protein